MSESLFFGAVSQETEVTDAHEAVGQDVEQEEARRPSTANRSTGKKATPLSFRCGPGMNMPTRRRTTRRFYFRCMMSRSCRRSGFREEAHNYFSGGWRSRPHGQCSGGLDYLLISRLISSTMEKSKTFSKGTSPVNFTWRLRSLTIASIPLRPRVPSFDVALINTP